MANLKIGMTADFNKALEAFRKVADESEAFKRSLNSLTKELEKTLSGKQKGEVREIGEIFNDIVDKIGLFEKSVSLTNTKLDTAKKTMNLIDSLIQKGNDKSLYTKEQTAELLGMMNKQQNKYKELVKFAQEQAEKEKALAEASRIAAEEKERQVKAAKEAEAAAAAQTKERLAGYSNTFQPYLDLSNMQSNTAMSVQAYTAVGDKVGALRAEYNGIMRQLPTIIKLYGEESVQVKTAAARYDQLGKQIKEFNRNSGIFGKTGEIFKNILKFQLLMKPVTMAISAVINGIKDSARAAAEAEQVYSKLATVFDGMSDSMERSQKLAGKIGTATSTAASALSTVGDLLQAQGMGVAQSLATAEEWVSKFQDIIAFKDVDMTLEEFAGNFMAGASGNVRNFRTFGSIVNESAVKAELARKGLDKLTGSELELAKVTTRAELALKQQANAIGATAREYDTAQSVTRRYTEANKRLEESVGKHINNVLKPIKEWWTDIANAIAAAAEMKDRYYSGQMGTGWTGSKENFRTLRSTTRKVLNTYDYEGNYDNAIGRRQASQIVSGLVRSSGASANEVVQVALEFVSAGSMAAKAFREVAEAVQSNADAEKVRQKAIDNWRTNYDTKESGVRNFYEAVAGLLPAGTLNMPNISFGSGTSRGFDVANNYLNTLESDAFKAAEMLIGKTLDVLRTGADPFSLATGGVTNSSLASGYAEQLKSLYEIASNYGIKNNKDVSGLLESIVKSVNGINGDVAKIEEENSRQKQIIARQGNAQNSVTSVLEGIKDSQDIRSLMSRGNSQSIASLIVQQRKAMEEFTYNLDMGGYSVEEYTRYVAELTGEQKKALDEAKQAEIDKAVNGEMAGVYRLIVSQLGDIGKFSQLIEGMNSDNKEVQNTSIVGLILMILQKMEVWDTLMEAIDEFFERFDGLWEPINMVIKFINESVRPINDAIMQELLPLLKGLALVWSTLHTLLTTILYAITGIYYATTFRFGKAAEKFAEIGELWKDYGKTVNKIADYTYKIASEGEEYNKALYEMFTRGLINYKEYKSMAGIDNSDTATFGSGYSGTYSQNPYYYNSGNVTIYVSGTKSMDEIYEFCEKKRLQIEVTG